MTTKLKIFIGFSVMVVLLGVVAFFGYSGLQTASTGFEEYRRLARFNVIASDIVSSLNKALGSIYLFTTTDDDAHLGETRTELSNVTALVKESDQFIALPERRQILAQLVTNGEKLTNTVNTIEGNLETVVNQYTKVILPMSHAMSAQILQMHDTALTAGNTYAAKLIAKAMGDLGTARSAASRFSQSRDEKDGARALETITKLGASMDEFTSMLVASDSREMSSKLREEYNNFLTAMNDMVAQAKAFQTCLRDIDSLSDTMSKDIGTLSNQVNDDMIAQGTYMLESNASAQKVMLAMSVGGVVLAVVLALLTIKGIMNVMRELGVFASEIAQGHFNYDVKITEKGEVGTMVEAMKEIPAELNRILEEYRNLELQVQNGQLAAEGNADRFHGDFGTLVRGTNAVLGRFRLVLENIPSPVVMLDGELKAAYLNTVAKEIAGDDYKGKTCLQLFAREDYNTDACSLKRAIESKHSSTSETRAHPRGKEMDISYTAIPMYDPQGKLASVLQLITDLTAIKRTQRTIMNVAAQAATISNRVAAASEQLSAQVEQVSRGAEMQRSRVDSTASAMTEMNATVLEVARNAGQASEQSDLTKNKATAGAELVNKVVASINTVNTVASAMHSNMQELGVQAESIGGVMNVISDIADQTNLLALNAAIEAARAGEYGRGFAVVADEVRKLAEKTMEATNEVGSNINAIQQSARVNIEAMGNASKAVSEATELAHSSGEALGEIVDLAASNSSVVASIATAAEEQSATSEEINTSISEINRVVGETSEGMIQASAAVQELSQMAQELNRVMDELK